MMRSGMMPERSERASQLPTAVWSSAYVVIAISVQEPRASVERELAGAVRQHGEALDAQMLVEEVEPLLRRDSAGRHNYAQRESLVGELLHHAHRISHFRWVDALNQVFKGVHALTTSGS